MDVRHSQLNLHCTSKKTGRRLKQQRCGLPHHPRPPQHHTQLYNPIHNALTTNQPTPCDFGSPSIPMQFGKLVCTAHSTHNRSHCTNQTIDWVSVTSLTPRAELPFHHRCCFNSLWWIDNAVNQKLAFDHSGDCYERNAGKKQITPIRTGKTHQILHEGRSRRPIHPSTCAHLRLLLNR
uniref:Uncharacterized protein n=1 Tax=Trypanosoma congolense (strain IL3000) TaxID=1068625 RepID=G0UQ47_TRYCI|nr:hypothetical protein TCIL3000_7_3220 [Trypanosoma congolense IL3000]